MVCSSLIFIIQWTVAVADCVLAVGCKLWKKIYYHYPEVKQHANKKFKPKNYLTKNCSTVPLGDWLEKKKFAIYNHKTTIWVPHEYYLNPELKKISSRAFWVIAILRFSPYVARVDFKGLISK